VLVSGNNVARGILEEFEVFVVDAWAVVSGLTVSPSSPKPSKSDDWADEGHENNRIERRIAKRSFCFWVKKWSMVVSDGPVFFLGQQLFRKFLILDACPSSSLALQELVRLCNRKWKLRFQFWMQGFVAVQLRQLPGTAAFVFFVSVGHVACSKGYCFQLTCKLCLPKRVIGSKRYLNIPVNVILFCHPISLV